MLYYLWNRSVINYNGLQIFNYVHIKFHYYCKNGYFEILFYRYARYDSYETQNDEANKAKRKREFDLIALKGIKTVIGCCTDKLETINSHLIDFEPKVGRL